MGQKKNPAKFLPNFPPNFPANNQKKHRRASAGARESFFFSESRFGGQTKIAKRRFEAIRANRSHVMNIGFYSANRFARIAPIRVANRRAI